MAKRKTVDVSFLKDSVNRALTDMADFQDKNQGPISGPAYRKGIATVLETVLHETGNYRGFCYTDTNLSSANPFGDETRRHYY